MELSEIGIRKFVVPKEEPETANIAGDCQTWHNRNNSCHQNAVPNTKKFISFITVEKVKTGISSIFNYVMAQFNKARHHDDVIKVLIDIKNIFKKYQNNASIIIASSVDFLFLIFFQTQNRSFLDTL